MTTNKCEGCGEDYAGGDTSFCGACMAEQSAEADL